MRFLRSPLGWVTLVVVLATTMVVGVTFAQVFRATHPPRHRETVIDFESVGLPVEEVEFDAVDGVRLRGWWIPGRAGGPAVILCHDHGSSKASLVHMAIPLRDAGFNLLLFDFRGHGESAGRRSTLGVDEKRDIVGAVDYLAGRPALDTRRIGVYGVGMGAHAAVLAARERSSLKVLVLDGLYPDAAFGLSRAVFQGWPTPARKLELLHHGMFALVGGARIGRQRAEDVIDRLLGRDVLLVAPADDSTLVGAMERMYATIPDQVDVDGNLVILPATLSGGLYGGDLERYKGQVAGFFSARLVF